MLSICGGFLLGLIFGIIAWVQTKRTGQRGRGMAIASVIISSVGIVAATATFVVLVVLAARDASQHPSANELTVDSCLTGVVSGQAADTYTVTPCEQPHNGQVYAVFDLPDSSTYPEGAMSLLGDMCGTRLQSYSSAAAADDTIDVSYLFPSPQSWAQGDRRVICIAVSTTGDRQGSLRT